MIKTSKNHNPARLSTYLAIFILSVIFISSVQARWVQYPIWELVQQSDTAVVGRLSSISDFAKWGRVEAAGIIEVDEVLCGRAKVGDKIPVRWTFNPGWSSSGDVNRDPGPAIWLLKGKEARFVLSAYHGRVELSQKSQVLKALENPIRIEQVVDPGTSTYTLRLMYRNFTSQTMELPLIQFSEGKLHVPEETSFTATLYDPANHSGSYVQDIRLAGDSIKFTSHREKIKLKPNQTYRINVPLNALFPSSHEYNEFTWSIKGIGESHKLRILSLAQINARNSSGDVYEGLDNPFWFNIFILLSYSPTREILIALGIGTLALSFLITNLYRRKQFAA